MTARKKSTTEKDRILIKIGACVAFEDALVELVDDYYLPIAEQKTSVIAHLDRLLSNEWAREVLQKMPEGWVYSLPTTLLAYECFKTGGLFHMRPELEREAQTGIQSELLCKAFHEKPWKYSYCFVAKRQQANFFSMIDLLSGEEFELFSKGMESTIQELGDKILFGVLRFWNGQCWQTYSNIDYFVGFQEFDLLSFARVLDTTCQEKTDVYRVLDQNLFQFLALFCFARSPQVVHQKQELGFSQTTCECDELPVDSLAKDFKISNAQGVYRLELIPYPDRMLVAEAFWAPKQKQLIVESSTPALRIKLHKAFLKHGVILPQEPDYDVGMAMLVTIHSILQKDLHTPLSRRFVSKPFSKMDLEAIDVTHKFMELLVEKLNNHQPYKLEELAQLAGLELESAQEVEKALLAKIKGL